MEKLYHVIKDQVEAAEFVVQESSDITDVPLLALKLKHDVLIGAIIHDEEVIIPRGNDMIRPGDRVIVVSKLMALHDLTDVLR